MGVAVVAVVGLVVTIVLANYVIGAIETYLGKPSLTFLKSNGDTVFSFAFDFNDAKEPTTFNRVKLRLFNPNGNPTQMEVSSEFEPKTESFAIDAQMKQGYIKFLGATNFDNARVNVELNSDRDGITHQFEMTGAQFRKKIIAAKMTVDQYLNRPKLFKMADQPPIDVPIRSFIADTVPGRGPQLAIATNPQFAHLFAGGEASGGGAAAAGGEVVAFSVAKVWIEPGCIVCNACEDIYPEVFDVQASTCLIRPNAPLDNGLRIQEAAEACPVEVIKFTKVG
jgi:ferredoxin